MPLISPVDLLMPRLSEERCQLSKELNDRQGRKRVKSGKECLRVHLKEKENRQAFCYARSVKGRR